MPTSQRRQRAFRWIVNLLRKHRIPFQVTGGFAASLYGSPRRFFDIDLLIQRQSLPAILPDIQRHLVFGPARYRDGRFDVFLATLNVYGTEVDLIMDSRIRDHRTGKWHPLPGPTESVRKQVFGQRVHVESREKLIRIKQLLGRGKDLADAAAMRKKTAQA